MTNNDNDERRLTTTTDTTTVTATANSTSTSTNTNTITPSRPHQSEHHPWPFGLKHLLACPAPPNFGFKHSGGLRSGGSHRVPQRAPSGGSQRQMPLKRQAKQDNDDEGYKYVSWNVAANPSVTILEQWGETVWFVSYDGPYASNRPRHIRLRKDTCERWPSNVRNGSQFELFELHKKRRAVMWKVRQLFWVDGTPAHFTIHYGPRPLGHFELVPPQAVPKDLAPQTGLANCAAELGPSPMEAPWPAQCMFTCDRCIPCMGPEYWMCIRAKNHQGLCLCRLHLLKNADAE